MPQLTRDVQWEPILSLLLDILIEPACIEFAKTVWMRQESLIARTVFERTGVSRRSRLNPRLYCVLSRVYFACWPCVNDRFISRARRRELRLNCRHRSETDLVHFQRTKAIGMKVSIVISSLSLSLLSSRAITSALSAHSLVRKIPRIINRCAL